MIHTKNKTLRLFKILILLFLFSCINLHAQEKSQMLCVGYYQTEDEAIEQLERFVSTYDNLKDWKKRAKNIRKGIIRGAELNKIPAKYKNAPFHTIIRDKKNWMVIQ